MNQNLQVMTIVPWNFPITSTYYTKCPRKNREHQQNQTSQTQKLEEKLMVSCTG